MTKRRSRAVMRTEDINEAVQQLLSEAEAEGARLRDRLGQSKKDPRVPDIDVHLRAGLRTALEDEFLPAVEASNGKIREWEFEREIVKKALVGLTAAALKDIASDRGLAPRGTKEALAERIAESYAWDSEQIARVVLAYEEEPSGTERGYTTRVFALKVEPELAQLRERLSYVENRYIRIGLARWFVFGPVETSDRRTVQFKGAFRSYRADVEMMGSAPSLSATATKSDSRLELGDGPALRVMDATVTAARAAVTALGLATDVEVLKHVPLAAASAKSSPSALLHPASEFMLDLLYNRFRDASFGELNLTMARFKVSDGIENEGETEAHSRRPTLRAVRFEGEHLLDSVAACRLLSVERRPLVDISLVVTVRSPEDVVRGRFPIRIAIESDHVLVHTGLGSGDLTISHPVHAEVVNAVELEMQQGLQDEVRLENLALRIHAQTDRDQPVDKARLLFDSGEG